MMKRPVAILCLTVCSGIVLPTVAVNNHVVAQNAPTIEVVEEPGPESKPEDDHPTTPDAPVGVELDPSLLEPVWDPEAGLRTKGVRPEEAESYYQILKHARDVDYGKLKDAAARLRSERITEFQRDPKNRNRKFGPFVDVFKNEEFYHGKPVQLRGRIRRLLEYRADENTAGIKMLYECWMFTEDSQRNPAVIVATSIPSGMMDAFKEQHEILDDVSATGYFFKMYVYESENGFRLAPMLLAPRIEWKPDTTPPVTPEPRGWLISGVAIAVTLFAVVVLWRVSRKDKDMQQRRLETATEASPDFNALPEDLSGTPDFSNLDDLPPSGEKENS